MKKISCLILLIVSVFSSAQNYYWYGNKKINLTPTPNRFVIATEKMSIPHKNLKAEWKKADSYVSKRGNLWYAVIDSFNLSSLEKNNIIYSIPTCINSHNGSETYPSHLFYVKLKKSSDYNMLSQYASQYNVSIEYNSEYLPLWYVLSAINSERNAIELANIFYESGLFAASEPDFWGKNDALCVNDTYFPLQWNLNNTGQQSSLYSGIDINYCNAISMVPKHRNIIIAVLDHGIQLDHPDLINNIVADSYDTESHSSPSVILGDHGTACAGIIGAVSNNNMGVSGVASNCKLMSISNSLVGSYASRYNRAEGISYAANHNASVISNSWGSSEQFTVIDDAIASALTNGRNGLGCVIVFASGNDNSSVSYPANSNSNIITVGAMSPCGERCNPTSCDGENWGSNYGEELDVMAPGVLIPTTDRTGYNGYSTTEPLDYIMNFNGTSAACPHVAGVAGLMLSVNPTLTQKQVADIIESTAQKVGGYSYTTQSGHPNGTWNNEMGYGLVDAYAAIIAAQEQMPIQGPDYVCDTTKYYLLNAPTAGSTIHWSIDNGSLFSPTYSIVGPSDQDTVYVRCEYINVTARGNNEQRLLDIDFPGEPTPSLAKTLSATISNGSGVVDSFSLVFRMPTGDIPTFSASASGIWDTGVSRTFTITNCTDVSDSALLWTAKQTSTPLNGGLPLTNTTSGVGRSFTYTPLAFPRQATSRVTITATNTDKECEERSFSQSFFIRGKLFLLANQEDETLTITISEEEDNVLRSVINIEDYSGYSIELWHNIYGCMRTLSVDNNCIHTDALSLPHGVYVVLLKKNNEVLAETKTQIQ